MTGSERSSKMTPMLTEATVVEYLKTRRILDSAIDARVAKLAGGVSANTFRISAPAGDYVVKQPRPFLAVSERWPASQARAEVEAAAIGRLQRITPQSVPYLLDYDADDHVLVLSATPLEWEEWRQLLLRGRVDPPIGARLGQVLASWHTATAAGSADLDAFQSLVGFEELRGRPYYRAVAARQPDLAEPMLGCLGELLGRRSCLVHGDFSPKNVLTGDGSALGPRLRGRACGQPDLRPRVHAAPSGHEDRPCRRRRR